MKGPNFRLPNTQASASLFIGILGLLSMAALVFLVFKGYNAEFKTIPYNASEGLGRFRPYFVYGGTAASLVIGGVAGLLGFNSIGQKRNDKQASSWLGMAAGALTVSIAPILFYAWRVLSEADILAG
ncbi:MAG: hypothetical protein MI923_07170 [Phycisphaerales bacterium]|nr:hypothetical protein [Phycisphaerales bacterium]